MIPLIVGITLIASFDTPSAHAQAIVIRDDVGRTVRLPHPAKRIISLIPSATETLIELGLANRIVGRTQYDTASAIRKLPSVGGGLQPTLETILALRPDLVITWSAQKRQDVLTRLADAGIPTFSLSTQDTTDIVKGIASIGKLTASEGAADRLLKSIRSDFAAAGKGRSTPKPSVLFLVSTDPPITAGPHAFITEIISAAGGTPLFPDAKINWPTVSLEEIARRKPEYIILPVGEFRTNAVSRLKQTPGWRNLDAVRSGRIIVVDANLTNRPGPHVGRLALLLRDSLAVHRATP